MATSLFFPWQKYYVIGENGSIYPWSEDESEDEAQAESFDCRIGRHEWTEYEGLTEKFTYCSKCDERKDNHE